MKLNIKSDWLVFFRFSIAIYAILNLFAFWKDIPRMLYDGGYLKPELQDALADVYSPTIYDIFVYLNKNNIIVNYDVLVNTIAIIYVVALISLLLGLFTRVSAAIALLLQIVIYKSMHLYLYGADFFLTMAIFYCVIFPKSKFSLDYVIFKFKQNPVSIKWSLLLLQIHVCIIYFFSGLDKGVGINWWNGEAIWKAVNSHDYNGLISINSLNIPEFVFIIAGTGTVAVEFLYPLFINLKATRKLWLSLTILMHLSIAVFMGLHFFAMIMIILNMAAFYFPYLKEEEEEEEANSKSYLVISGK